MPYDPVMVQPMRDELTELGFQELRTEQDVEDFFAPTTGTEFLVVNSVCGCAAGMARPSVRIALEQARTKPDRMATVFAGQDLEATRCVRSRFAGQPPSSPSMALRKDGKVVHFLPRDAIEGRAPQEIAAELVRAFETYCG